MYMNKVKNIYNIAETFIKNNLLMSIAVAILIMGIFLYRANNKVALNTYTVVNGDISESIEVAGKVKSSSQADLNFEKSGVISSVKVKVGQKVVQGQILATLSSADLQAQVVEASAAVESAKANLNAIIEGARPEEIAVKEQVLTSAKSDLDTLSSQILDTYSSVENSLNDILYYKLSGLFTQNGDSYKYTSSNCDQSSASSIETLYKKSLNDLKLTSSLKNSTFADAKSIQTSLQGYTDEINQAKFLLNNISQLLTAACVVSDSTLADKRILVSAAKTTAITATSEINLKKTAISAAINNIERANKDLTLIRVGGDKNKIEIQRAAVSQSEARLMSAEAQLSKNIIKAPFNGVITVVDATAGEIAIVSKPSISIMAEASFEIEVKLSEIDAAKIVTGQAADITLDAFGNDTHWAGEVSRIDPSSTENNGVANYKAIISFEKNDNIDKIKPGMTANAKLNISNKINILLVPSKYIKTSAGITTVMLKDTNSKNKFNIREISIGMRGDNGKIEVLSGLKEGDILQEFVK